MSEDTINILNSSIEETGIYRQIMDAQYDENCNLKRAVAYARFSSDMQREESIEAQLIAIKAYAESNGYVVIRAYVDKAITGTTDNRPEFRRMMFDARNQEFDAVIVHKFDRFARDRNLSLTAKNTLQKFGVSLLSVVEHLTDDPESIILESVILGMNEYYSKNLAREVMKGLRVNASKCLHTGGKPCLGYDVDPQTLKLVINEFEAEAVRIIFKRYLEGESYTSINKELNSKGYTTKRGLPFGKNSLYEILHNEKYTGVYTYNKSASKNFEGKFNRHKIKPESEIIRVEGGVPAIISKEDFDEVQKKLMSRKNKAGSYTAKQEYLLSNKIICGECGSTFNGCSRKANETHPLYVSYRCSKRNRDIKCKNPEVRRELIEAIVLKKLSDIIFDEKTVPLLVDRYNEYVRTKNVETAHQLEVNSAEVKKCVRDINHIVELLMDVQSPTLKEKLRELEIKKALLEANSDELKKKLDSLSIDEKRLKVLFKEAKKMLEEGTLKNKKLLIDKYVKCVTVYKDRIVVEFNIAEVFTLKNNFERT